MSAQPARMNQHEQQSDGIGLLKWVERIGNKLPNPFMLFLYLIAILMIVTALLSFFHVAAIDPIPIGPGVYPLL